MSNSGERTYFLIYIFIQNIFTRKLKLSLLEMFIKRSVTYLYAIIFYFASLNRKYIHLCFLIPELKDFKSEEKSVFDSVVVIEPIRICKSSI